jgi:hypothetical protein
MSALARIGAGVLEFVVGDDWRIAVGVVLAIATTALVAGAGSSAWWVMAAAVPVILAASVRRGARGKSATDRTDRPAE